MNDHKEQGNKPSMLERLQNVLGPIPQVNQSYQTKAMSLYDRSSSMCGNAYDPRYKKSNLKRVQDADNLMKEYYWVLSAYLSSVEFSEPQNDYGQMPLLYPFQYFYSIGKRIYSVIPFRYGKTRKSNFITLKTFPSFLTNECKIVYKHSEQVNCLYESLCRLLLQYPYTQYESVCQKLNSISPTFFSALNSLIPCLALSENGNLYFHPCLCDQGISQEYTLSRYRSILSIYIEVVVPDSLLKRFFCNLIDIYRDNISVLKLAGHQISAVENVFSDAAQTQFQAIRYSEHEDKFAVRAISKTAISRSIVPKHLPLSKNKTIQWVPEGASFFLRQMCGTDLGLIDAFSMFLSEVFSPTKGGLTVLLSPKNKNSLDAVLEKILDLTLVKSTGKPWSLNRISKKQYLHTLFLGQTDGASAVLTTAAPVSPANIAILRKLLKGKPISIVTRQFPTQHYENTLHIICVTSNRKQAMDLHEVMKARVIDFSVSETKIAEPIEFSGFDLQWLRTTFLLHGLKLRTLNGTDKNVASKHAKKETAGGSFEDSLSSFLEDYCRVESGYFCSTDEIYESYTAFIAAAHGVLTPPVTKRVFNKQLRALLNTQARYKTVQYKRNHVSRSLPSLWGYDGLRPFTCIQPTTPPQVPTKEQILQKYLSEMSSYKISFDGFMSVELRTGKNDPV